MRLRATMLTCLYAVLALGAAWLGMSIPMHFRAVSPLVLAEAGHGTLQLEELARDFLDAGEPGPARLLISAGRGDVNDATLSPVLEQILSEHPSYRLSGGPAPYYEQWLQAARIDPAVGPPDRVSVLPLLLPRDHRRHLLAFLEQSSNRTVQALLETRDLSGFERFLPVFSAGGHPLDATILATALLEQSDAWAPEISRFLRNRATRASEDPRALSELENVYLSVLTLGSRLDWMQLVRLVSQIPAPSALDDFNAAAQLAGDRFRHLYAGALLADEPAAVANYLLERGEEGWRVLALALEMGQGALQRMIDFNQPLYDPPAFVEALPAIPGRSWVREITQRQPEISLVAKSLALILSGYLLALALESLVRIFLRPHPYPRGSVVHAFHLISGLGLAALVWILSEPKLLEFAPNEGGTLRLQLAQIIPLAQAEGIEETSPMLDQVTLLVLLLFFVLQGIVFVFSLIKIKEIRSQPVPAQVKLRLLDNEENLFDLGLYVGLGGTVSSLLLVVLELVDASLMAAYASTLFGIIFVAVLKVMVLRPFRRRLILESTQTPPGNPTDAASMVS